MCIWVQILELESGCDGELEKAREVPHASARATTTYLHDFPLHPHTTIMPSQICNHNNEPECDKHSRRIKIMLYLRTSSSLSSCATSGRVPYGYRARRNVGYWYERSTSGMCLHKASHGFLIVLIIPFVILQWCISCRKQSGGFLHICQIPHYFKT